jgi:hypothetical protein
MSTVFRTMAAVVASVLVVYVFVGEIRHGQRVERANSLYAQAASMEQAGQIQAAYTRYLALCEGALEIRRSDVPANACRDSSRLRKALDHAHYNALRALTSYKAKHGRYPDSITEVQSAIAQELVPAFNGLRYTKVDETNMNLTEGLPGLSFSLAR